MAITSNQTPTDTSTHSPIPSAKDRTLPKALTIPAILYISIVCAGLLNDPLATLFAMASLFGLLCAAFALLRLCATLARAPKDSPLIELGGHMPTIAILLPVYHEAHMIETLLSHVMKTDYPADRLDVIIICEQDDTDTIRAAHIAAKAACCSHVRVLITNGTGPKTKPNALNQALATTLHDIITVPMIWTKNRRRRRQYRPYSLSIF